MRKMLFSLWIFGIAVLSCVAAEDENSPLIERPCVHQERPMVPHYPTEQGYNETDNAPLKDGIFTYYFSTPLPDLVFHIHEDGRVETIGSFGLKFLEPLDFSNPWCDLLRDAPQTLLDEYQMLRPGDHGRDHFVLGHFPLDPEEAMKFSRAESAKDLMIPNNPAYLDRLSFQNEEMHPLILARLLSGSRELNPWVGPLGELNKIKLRVQLSREDRFNKGLRLRNVPPNGTEVEVGAAELTLHFIVYCNSWGNGNLGKAAWKVYQDHKEVFIDRLRSRLYEQRRVFKEINSIRVQLLPLYSSVCTVL
jgi:hypothetical protein